MKRSIPRSGPISQPTLRYNPPTSAISGLIDFLYFQMILNGNDWRHILITRAAKILRIPAVK